MPAENVDPKIDFDKYEYKANEVMPYAPVYNTTTGLHGGLKKKLACITLRGDPKELWILQRKKFFSVLHYEKANVKHF